jgi:hypothetical protein
MKKLIYLLLLIQLSSCAELSNIISVTNTALPLTEYDVSQGLKEALRVSADSAASRLGATNGYYSDELVKILLPPEANILVENAGRIPGGEKLLEDIVKRINRAAEQAAREAGPVFWKAIQSMSIEDAFNILNGSENAATLYLKETTYDDLFSLYNPKIKKALDAEIVAGISANESWESLIDKWNALAGSIVGQLADLKTVNVDLNNYLTEQALNGLFIKLADEEQHIRQDPAARVTDLLKRVFS